MKKIELLAPAGDLEKLKIALKYGADAVYFGGELFSLRAGAGNLSLDDIREALTFAHQMNKRCYMALNIFAHNEDIEGLTNYLNALKAMSEENPDHTIDAFIVSDPGVISLLKSIISNAEVHLSTQANMTNYVTAKFWYDFGVKRIVLARELTFNEIKELRAKLPEDMEFEAFVHGAMCISYSGRCLLSNFMIQRDANHGACAHPCRWKYALVEEKRPGQYFPVEEDDRGTYIMNSKDLCMIEHIPELVESGLASLKIEGRVKSSFYVAQVVNAYRHAIDSYYENPEGYKLNSKWMDELLKASHRQFTTGFYFNKPNGSDQNYLTSSYERDYTFTGLVLGYIPETGLAKVEQRNKMVTGEKIEIFGPDMDFYTQIITEMYDEDMNPIESCPHAQQIIYLKVERPVKPDYMLRKQGWNA